MASKTRKDYITLLWMYEKRRSVLDKHNPKDRLRMKTLYRKIRTYRAAIVRIDKRMAKVTALLKKTNDYFNLDISKKKGGKKLILARNCYYKYGMENSMYGRDLEKIINRPRFMCSRSRLTFTKTFKTNIANKETYHKFKEYIQNQ